jgi:uncharacterized membrane protein YhaH (DUF805 family)
VPFGAVKSRLFAAVTANPSAYPEEYGWSRRQELRSAKRLSDLIKSEEARAIERLKPAPLWWQWLFWEGRCSRLAFLAAVAGLVAVWRGMGLIGLTTPVFLAIVSLSGALLLSAIVRRLHDLKLSGWWMAAWWLWSWICLEIHNFAPDIGGVMIAVWLWWIPNLCIFGCLGLRPGTVGPNRYGYATRRAQRREEVAPSTGSSSA